MEKVDGNMRRQEDPTCSEPSITVVICTYNRAELLRGAIQSVCSQELAPSLYEVLVVDNNSTDHTREVVEKFVEQYPNVRYCAESKQGLSHARNRGYEESKSEYVAYFDDDARAPASWLAAAQRIIKERSPALFGGPYDPFYDRTKPVWFPSEVGKMSLGDRARALEAHESLSGSNLFVRRSLLREVGGFDPTKGMNGRNLAYGEETFLQQVIRDRFPDARAYYDPALCIEHLVSSRKMSLLWRARSRFAQGRFQYCLERDTIGKERSTLAMLRKAEDFAIRMALLRPYGLAVRDRERYPFARGYLYSVWFLDFSFLGYLREWVDARTRKAIFKRGAKR